MIISTLIYLFAGLANAILFILPSVEIMPAGFQAAWDMVSGFMSNMLYVFDLSDAYYLINIQWVALIGVVTFKMGDWVYTKIRGG